MLKEKYLDESYLKQRISQHPQVRNGRVVFKIEKSNREDSKSIYVAFYCDNIKGHTIRFSDHYLHNGCFHTQVIIDPTEEENNKAIFNRTIDNAIRKTIANTKYVLFRRIKDGKN